MPREKGNAVWKTATKICKLICNRHDSSVHLEIWTITGNGKAFSFVYPFAGSPTNSANGKNHWVGMALPWRLPVSGWFKGAIADCCAFPLLFPRLFFLRLSDTWSAAKGGAIVWNASDRYVLAPMPAPMGHGTCAFSLVVMRTEPLNCFCFFYSLVLQRSWDS